MAGSLFSPFSLALRSVDLWDPEEDEGRSVSSGFGCMSVNGSSATNSLWRREVFFLIDDRYYNSNSFSTSI